jgi:hypothetical protein
MLAFSSKWIEPIRAGTKTVTLRKWPTARVRVGGVYDAATIGFPRKTFAKLEVTGLRRIKLRDVDEALAKRDGAQSAEEVRAYWMKQGFQLAHELWLVEFRLR